MAARNALAAATMVASGMTGIDDVFSGPGNYFEALDGDPDVFVAGLGTRYEIMHADLKKWSVGSPAQAALDAVEAMLAERSLPPDDIATIEVRLHVQEAHVVAARSMPSISVQHLVALLLVDRNLTLASTHDDARVHDPAVAALRARSRSSRIRRSSHAKRSSPSACSTARPCAATSSTCAAPGAIA